MNRRQRITTAAKELFFENGYENTTVDEIIRYTDTSKGCFYHHFKDKAQLGKEVIDTFSQHLGEVLKNNFLNEDANVLFMLSMDIMIHMMIKSIKFRRLVVELSSYANLPTPSLRFQKMVSELGGTINLNDKDFLLTQCADNTFELHFFGTIAPFLDQLDPKELYYFYMKTWFGFWNIDPQKLDPYFKKEAILFHTLTINYPDFFMAINLKN